MLHELVKLVHIDIHEELRREIAERQTQTCSRALKTTNDLLKEPENVAVWYALLEYPQQPFLVYGRKELPHVAFQHPDRSRVIAGDAVCEPLEMLERFVIALTSSARIGTAYEALIKKRIQQAVNGVMEETVAYARLVYAARLRVRNAERFVCGMRVGFRF